MQASVRQRAVDHIGECFPSSSVGNGRKTRETFVGTSAYCCRMRQSFYFVAVRSGYRQIARASPILADSVEREFHYETSVCACNFSVTVSRTYVFTYEIANSNNTKKSFKQEKKRKCNRVLKLPPT